MGRQLRPGDLAPDFCLPTTRGGQLDTRALVGRMRLLSFHRYAT